MQIGGTMAMMIRSRLIGSMAEPLFEAVSVLLTHRSEEAVSRSDAS
jgi:hypothetical protein